MRTLFIVNPAAGHGRGEKRWAAARRRLVGRGDWEERATQRPGHGAELSRRALEDGFEAIVAVGGDGTVAEAVDGYLSAPEALRARAAVGTWPAGSGCDLARHFGIRSDWQALEALLDRPCIKRLDAARVDFRDESGAPGARYFLNVTSFGVAGDVALRVKASGKPLGGALTYLLCSLGALLTVPPRDFELVADGEALPSGRYHLVSVANTSTTGGGMKIAPGADAQDGALDLVTVGDLSRWELLRRFPGVYRGTHLGRERVTHRLIRRLEARSTQPVYLNIDGEAVGLLPARFEVLPSALPFLLPAS